MKINHNNIINFGIIFLLLPSFFYQTLLKNGTLQIVSLVTGFTLILVHVLASRCLIHLSTIYISLFLFFTICVISIDIDYIDSSLKWFVVFGFALLGSFAAANTDQYQWGHFFLQMLSYVGLFYAVVTILCWIFPDLYTNLIYPRFFSRIALSATRLYKAGFTNHYSTNGMYLVLGIIGSVSLFILKNRKRVLLVLLLQILALILTTKRAHLVFSLVSCIFAYLLYARSKGLGKYSKVLIALMIGLMLFNIASDLNADIGMIATRFTDLGDDDTFGGRIQFYTLCIDLWRKHPFIGNGWDSFTRAINLTARGARSMRLGNFSLNAHNVYLQILAEQGVIGLITFMCGVLLSLYKTIKYLLTDNNMEESESSHIKRALMSSSLALQLFFLLYCITGNPLYDMQMYVPWLFAIALSFSITRTNSKFE